jgi:hypothetical protein
MKVRLLVAAALAAALTALPTAALAKGATTATIRGSGPGGPVKIDLRGVEGESDDLGILAELSGLYPAVWGQQPDPMLPARPAGDLGQRFTVTWGFPYDNDRVDRIQQDLYPYAGGGPVTFVRAGQRLFDSTVPGGWFRGSESLRQQLIAFGLPDLPVTAKPPAPAPAPAPQAPAAAPAPVPASDGTGPWPWVAGAVLLLAVAGAFVVRRSAAGRAASAAR